MGGNGRSKRGYLALFFTASLSLMTAVALAKDPVFLETFPSQQLSLGDALTLQCRAQGQPIPRIFWLRDNQPITDADGAMIAAEIDANGVVTSRLQVRHVRARDCGEYSCVASSRTKASDDRQRGQEMTVADGTVSVSYTGRVDVYGVQFIRPLPNVTAISGHKFVVKCYTSGLPRRPINWYKGGALVSVSHRISLANHTLTIHRLHPDDAGWYTCRGHSGLTRNFYLTIAAPPVIDYFSFQRRRKIGDRLSVMCVVSSGDLPLDISWTKDGGPINSNLDVVITRSTSYVSVLSINNVQPAHGGNYTCHVTNPVAAVAHTSPLIVNVPPFWLAAPVDTRKLLNARAVLDCLAGGSPTPRRIWMKLSGDSHQYTTLSPTTRRRVYPNGTLVISTMRQTDRGSYMCLVSNHIGVNISKIITVTVDVPAHAVNHSIESTVRQGEPLTLFCHVTGNPPLRVQWGFRGQKLYNDHNIRIAEVTSDSGDWRNSTLTILDTSGHHGGHYVCNSSNVYGQDSRRMKVVILVPPEPPSIRVRPATKTSLNVSWSPRGDGGSSIIGYILMYKFTSEPTMRTIRLEPRTLAYSIPRLRCGSEHKVCVSGVNDIGVGDCSELLRVSTLGRVSFTPLLSTVEATSVELNISLDRGGCTVAYFTMMYRVRGDTQGDWVDSGVNVKPSNHTILRLFDLHPSTQYMIKVTAHGDAGQKHSKLLVTTDSYTGHVLVPNVIKERGGKRRDIVLIVPLAVMSFVALVVGVAVAWVVRRRRRHKHSGHGSDSSHDDIVGPSPQSDHSDKYDNRTVAMLETSEDSAVGEGAWRDGVWRDDVPTTADYWGFHGDSHLEVVSGATLPFESDRDRRNKSYDSYSSPDSDYGNSQQAYAYSYTDVTYPQFSRMFFAPSPPKPDHKHQPVQNSRNHAPPCPPVPPKHLSYPLTCKTKQSTPVRSLTQPNTSGPEPELILSPVQYASADTIQAMFTAPVSQHAFLSLPPRDRSDTQSSVTTVSSSHEELTRAFGANPPEPIYHTLLPLHEAEIGPQETPCLSHGSLILPSNESLGPPQILGQSKNPSSMKRVPPGVIENRSTKKRPYSDECSRRSSMGSGNCNQKMSASYPDYGSYNPREIVANQQQQQQPRPHRDVRNDSDRYNALFFGSYLPDKNQSSILQLEDYADDYNANRASDVTFHDKTTGSLINMDIQNSNNLHDENQATLSYEHRVPPVHSYDFYSLASPSRDGERLDNDSTCPNQSNMHSPCTDVFLDDLDVTPDSGIVAFTQTPPNLLSFDNRPKGTPQRDMTANGQQKGHLVQRKLPSPGCFGSLYIHASRRETNEELTFGFTNSPYSLVGPTSSRDVDGRSSGISLTSDRPPYLDVNMMVDAAPTPTDQSVTGHNPHYTVV